MTALPRPERKTAGTVCLFSRHNIPAFVLLFACLLFFTPFFIVGFFNHPGVEDIAESVVTHQLGVWGHIKELYLTFDGRYFAAFLYSINPLVYHQLWLYKLIPLIYFVLFYVGVYFLLDSLVGQSVKTIWKFTAATLFCVCVLYLIPRLSFAFYYMASSMVYMTPVVLTFFLLTLIIKIGRLPHCGKRLVYTAVSSLLIIAIIGSNELFIILTPALLLFVLFLVALKKMDGLPEMLVLFATALLAVYINATSPGIHFEFDDSRRMSASEKDFDYLANAICKTIYFSNQMVLDCLQNHHLLLVLTVIYIPLGFNLARKNRLVSFGWNIPVLPAILVYAILVHVIAFPYYFSMGEEAANYTRRVMNISYIFFLSGWFICLQLVISRLYRKSSVFLFPFNRIPAWVSIILIILVMPLGRKFNHVLQDLTSGEAYGYHCEMEKRFEKCYNAERYFNGECTLMLDTLTHKPRTLYSGNRLEGTWIDSYEAYFSVERIEVTGRSHGATASSR